MFPAKKTGSAAILKIIRLHKTGRAFSRSDLMTPHLRLQRKQWLKSTRRQTPGSSTTSLCCGPGTTSANLEHWRDAGASRCPLKLRNPITSQGTAPRLSPVWLRSERAAASLLQRAGDRAQAGARGQLLAWGRSCRVVTAPAPPGCPRGSACGAAGISQEQPGELWRLLPTLSAVLEENQRNQPESGGVWCVCSDSGLAG